MAKSKAFVWGLLNVLFGLLPSLAFFAWVERNMALPWLPLQLDWPWIRVAEDSLTGKCAWDVALVLAFGALHSLFAQEPAHRLLKRFVPPRAIRTVYLLITGLSLLAVMGLWQHTGTVLWALPLGWTALNVLSVILFWGLMTVSLGVMSRFDALAFVGLRQLGGSDESLERTAGTGRLDESGLYGRVRHPIYTFTSLAFACAPLMTLDRALVCGACLGYLSVGIPIEERKLVRTFGPAYEEYRRRVPALIPLLFASRRK